MDIDTQLLSSSSSSSPKASPPPLYTIIKYPDKIIIKRLKGDFIEISTSNGNVSIRRLDSTFPIRLSTAISLTPCHGILGLYQLSGSHLIAVIAESMEANGVPIPGVRRVNKVQLVDVPINNGSSAASSITVDKMKDPSRPPDKLRQLLLEAFHMHVFYYSTGEYDISRSLQSNYDTSQLENEPLSSSSSSVSVNEKQDRLGKVESRFFWNLNNIRALTSAGCNDFVTPVVNAWTA